MPTRQNPLSAMAIATPTSTPAQSQNHAAELKISADMRMYREQMAHVVIRLGVRINRGHDCKLPPPPTHVNRLCAATIGCKDERESLQRLLDFDHMFVCRCVVQ